MARNGYPAEFRRRALDLVAAGKPVAEVARLLEVSEQSTSAWPGYFFAFLACRFSFSVFWAGFFPMVFFVFLSLLAIF